MSSRRGSGGIAGMSSRMRVLSGLAVRFRSAGDSGDARRAAGLRLLLPVDDELRAKIRAELA